MAKSQIKIPRAEHELTISINLPEDFIIMCEFLNITPKQALITYLRHVKFYNYIINEKEGVNSEATAIFKKFKETQLKTEGLKVAKHHKLHLAPIKKIISLGMAGEGSNSQKYAEIIEKWHTNIFKTL
ncbi:hypothetical protein SAMN05421827_102254 [Pedobacter terrae]|uniref:Uncharacterized protein n=1 Tax=Pedobacter terrae TaxID=405671 RepID=A0A1G7QC04_9SPHI|nr:hypothetical protein [Pedobacter terrae]SDF96056.1 hypothetical protein SAMN05421827_102254 [Pedobacter terrae]